MKTERHNTPVKVGQIWLCGDHLCLNTVRIFAIFNPPPNSTRAQIVMGYIQEAHKVVEMEAGDFVRLLAENTESYGDCVRVWSCSHRGWVKSVEYTPNREEALRFSRRMFDDGELTYQYHDSRGPTRLERFRWWWRMVYRFKTRSRSLDDE